ncbi:MAG: hypothetical protein NC923_08210 [Candidatus Omnitrophica bacterium]|nr:hypothetical protein [Candidatus Omnitrophota bacterium]
MNREGHISFSWDFYSLLAIAVFALLQVLWWPLAPQFIDSYYHLLTSWGFIKAGGYTGWDFWQYAPYGRPHIYPPIFQLLLAFMLKMGFGKIFLLKITETLTPILALFTFRYFTSRYFGSRFTFFCLTFLISSFSFYLSFVNNIPATLAIIFGLLAFDQMFQKNLTRAVILLSLTFYTHIGIPWFLLLTFFFYGLLDRNYRRIALSVALLALCISAPIIWKQLANVKYIHVFSIKMERYFCEFKPFVYLFALPGLWFIWLRGKIYRFIFSLFLASLVFLSYPYRFFSAQGFMPFIFLAATTLDCIYERAINSKKRRLLMGVVASALLFMCVFSPTFALRKELYGPVMSKWRIFDSALVDMFFAGFNKRLPTPSVWFPKIYLPAAELIKENSNEQDIIYSPHYIVGVCLAALSDRPTANRLLGEVDAALTFDPFITSKIVVFLKDDKPQEINKLIYFYNLIKIGENDAFIIYKNRLCKAKVSVTSAVFPFWAVLTLGGLVILLFAAARKSK